MARQTSYSTRILLQILFLISVAVAAARISDFRGSSVHLPCPSPFHFNFEDTVVFEWKKMGTPGFFCSYQVTNNITTVKFCESKFYIIEPHKLYIINPKKSDSGRYNCSIERIVPPPTTDSFYIVDLQVQEPPGLVLERQNNSDPSCIQLRCTMEGLDPVEVIFTWSRQGSTEPLSANQSSKLSSSLVLCQSEWREGDIITCKVNHHSLSESISLPRKEIECCDWEHHPCVIRVAILFSFSLTVAIIWIIMRVRMYQAEKGLSVVTTEKFQTVTPTNLSI